jgi:hypothetical protein
MSMMFKYTAGAALIAAATLASGCASNPARASSTVPLQVPEPPARQPIAPVPAAAPPPEVTATAPAPRIATPPPAPAGPAATPATPAPVPAAAASAPPATPPPDLRPAGTSGRTLTGLQVLESINRTKQKLALIDRRRLSAGKSADYDSAQRFLAQAADAVKANNLMLAQSSTEKAETLADGLR